MIQQLIIYSLIAGSIYALIAIGFSLVFGIADILNLSHGTYYMIAGYMVFTMLKVTHNLVLSSLMSIVITTLFGLLTYLVMKSVIDSTFRLLIATFSLGVIIQEIMFISYGVSTFSIPNLIEGSINILGVTVVKQGIVAAFTAILSIVGVYIYLEKTKTGRSMRAISQNVEVAMMCGINVNKIKMTIVVLAAFLASIAGVLYIPLQALHPTMWMHALVISFVIVVLGGMGSIKGTLIAAFIIAFFEIGTTMFFSTGSYLKTAVSLFIMLLILAVRPQGLFGKYMGVLEVQR